MRGLTIIVAGTDRSRLRAALTLAATQAALGARARIFVEGEAVALLAAGSAEDDTRFVAAGLPSAAELLDSCLSLGARVTVCQSGLALAALNLRALDPRLESGGMTGLLASLGDDRLLAL